MSSTPNVTRFAPSPTGHLHIGGARTALFCWAFARHTGGRFMIRLEDTDVARSSESSAVGILHDLAWLGLDWDDGPEYALDGKSFGGDERGVGPYRQSERLELYNEAIERLVESGAAYAAFESPEEISAARAEAVKRKQQYRYDRAALKIPADERARRVAAGEPHVIRFRTPDDAVEVEDVVLGTIRIEPEQLDDFVIRKRDGYPTYHFAVVVDDELMGVTHILRGQEHLINTPRHVMLQQALGYRTPEYAHMPLIFNDKGAKMSKRERDGAARDFCKQRGVSESPIPDRLAQDAFDAWKKDKKQQLEGDVLEALAEAVGLHLPEVSVDDFRRAGYLPEVITNFIALLGWNPGGDVEKFDMDFLASKFELGRIGKTNARFDRTKLMSFNGDFIAEMAAADFAGRLRAFMAAEFAHFDVRLKDTSFRLGEDDMGRIAAVVQPRSKTLVDACERLSFAFVDAADITYDDKAVKKNLEKNDGAGYGVLRDLLERFEALAASGGLTGEAGHTALQSYAEEKDIKLGNVAQPLRVALTGSTVSPGMDETLDLLGADEVLARMRRCLELQAASASRGS